MGAWTQILAPEFTACPNFYGFFNGMPRANARGEEKDLDAY